VDWHEVYNNLFYQKCEIEKQLPNYFRKTFQHLLKSHRLFFIDGAENIVKPLETSFGFVTCAADISGLQTASNVFMFTFGL